MAYSRPYTVVDQAVLPTNHASTVRAFFHGLRLFGTFDAAMFFPARLARPFSSSFGDRLTLRLGR
jgi:hypothetical protein